MLNLEFHGLDTISPILRAKLKELLKDATYYKEIVLSYQGSYAVSLYDYGKAPFIRVWATRQEEVDDIVKRLDPLDMNIELPPLLSVFVPKKSTREKAIEKLLSLRPVAGTDAYFDYGTGESKPALRIYSEAEFKQSRQNQPGNHVD